MLGRVVPIFVLSVLLVACGGDDDEPAAGSTSTSSSTTSTSAPAVPAVTATVDWTARTVEVAGTDIDVAFCEGEAPLLCLSSADGMTLGVIEHAEYEPVPDLDAFAEDFAASMREDRTSHCDPAFELEQDETSPSSLFDAAGVRYGYTGTIDGRLVERVVGHAALVDDRLHIVTANFLADDGCLARESELPIDVVEEVEPILDALAAGSTR